ncbi:MAG TPA: ACT domain-containing protein [Candidatus Binatus sp.]|nr:ACT domain-containing protein [Candidatus Binatus sp.]
MANEFVVQLRNQPGALAILAESLAGQGIDVRAIGGGGLGDVGHVIMTTTDDEATRAVLESGGYTFVEGESILAEVDDRPGGMARIARALADAGVNIRGHLFLGRWGDRAMLGFVVDKPELARPILERKSPNAA